MRKNREPTFHEFARQLLLSPAPIEVIANVDLCGEIGLEEPLDMGTCLIDATCLEANIHFPVDWKLLRGVAVTLLKAVKLIRSAGLLCRMPKSPAQTRSFGEGYM